MFNLSVARTTIKNRSLAFLCVILASVTFSGCYTTTNFSKTYDRRIRMTKAEAVQYLSSYLRNEKNLSVDDRRLAFTFQRKIIDAVTQSGLGLYGNGTITTTTRFHYEDVFADIVFVEVVRIGITSHPDRVYVNILDRKGVNLTSGLVWTRVPDEFVSALLALCPNVESGSSTIDPSEEIHPAIAQGDSPRLISLLEANPGLVNVKTDYGSPLYIASENGKRDVAALLIERGAKVNEVVRKVGGEFTPLYVAAENGHKDVAELLLAKGADVNVKTDRGFTPLHLAALNNHKAVAELLLAKGAQVNAKSNSGITPLYSAAENNRGDVAELLIARGADPDAGDKNGWTPLHVAASNGARNFAELLIGRGATVDAKSDGGFTPLYTAAEKNRRDVAELLIASKADVNVKNKAGWAPLHKSAEAGHKEMADLLIAKGADVNAKNKDGRTPLHIAAEKNHKDIADLLLAKGADVNAKDRSSWTPLHVATQGRHWEIANLLRQKGGVE